MHHPNSRLLAALLAAAVCLPASAQCQPEWLPGAFGQFASYGTDQGVDASTVWYSPGSNIQRLVIGGRFTTVAGGAFGHVATWDGTSWIRLGTGLDGNVTALTVFNGDLVATGSFTNAGGTVVSNIARWDGLAWRALGAGLNAPGLALAVYNGQLCAGGQFTSAGGVANTSHIASWNGSAWQALGVGASGDVNALCIFGGDLIVGGAFLSAGSVAWHYLARWNGSAWSGFTYSPNGPLYSLAVRNNGVYDTLFIGGEFSTIQFIATAGLAQWSSDLFGWSAAGLVGGWVYALTNYGSELIAGGSIGAYPNEPWHIRQYPYSTATDLGPGVAPTGRVKSLTVYNDSVIVGGVFDAAGGAPAQNLAQWSGSTWSELRPGPNAPVRALLPSGPGFYAAGDFDFTIDSTNTAHRIISTDGSSAQTVTNILGPGPPNGTNGSIHALGNYTTGTILPHTSLIVGGSFTAGGGLSASNMAQFDLSGWAPMGTGTDGAVNAIQQYRLSSSNNHVVVTGEFSTAGGVPCNHIAQWNGAWTALGSGLAGVSGNALALYNGELYVGGNFSSAGGVPASDLAHWNGTSWNAAGGTSFTGGIYAMVVYNGQLISAGDFQSLSGPIVRFAAAWSGSAWIPMDNGLPLPGSGFFPLAVAVHNGDLYLGGNYSITDGPGDGIFNSTVFRWTGSSWVTVSGPLSGGVFALASAAGNLWAGGSFTVASGHATPHLAKMTCGCYANCDNSTSTPMLNVNDFICFQARFAAGDPYANCDGSTTPPVLNVNDFICFQARFAAGCP